MSLSRGLVNTQYTQTEHYESACSILGIEHYVYTFGSWPHTVIESVICTQITTSHVGGRYVCGSMYGAG